MTTLARIAIGVSVLADVAGFITLIWWIRSRKRLAADTLGRAQAESDQIRRQAEREAESLKKEAQLEAREKTHTLVSAAEQKARERQLEIASLEQGLADRTRALTERVSATDKLERDLRGRDAAAADIQKRAEAAALRADQLLAERQRELQRIAGMTADEGREVLLKQIEADARRDAANLVKRLETEARETA